MGVLDERQPLLKFAGLGLLDGELVHEIRVGVFFQGVGVFFQGVGMRLEWVRVFFEGVGVWLEWMCVGIQLGLYGLEVRFQFAFGVGEVGFGLREVRFQFGFGISQFRSRGLEVSPYIFSLDYLNLWLLGPYRVDWVLCVRR